MAALGCGPEALPQKRLTAKGFAERLTALVGEQRYARAAGAVARAMAGEDGLARAAEVVAG